MRIIPVIVAVAAVGLALPTYVVNSMAADKAAPAAGASQSRLKDESSGYKADNYNGEISGGPQIPAIKPSEYTALGKLPDWSGDWEVDEKVMAEQNKTIQPPWNDAAQAQVKAYLDATRAGKPPATTQNKCLPTGMPALMNQNHNIEIWFAPRRVFLFNEIDNMDFRRIYTDGRKIPDDPDLSYMGYSVGHWERDTLIVETAAILPEVPFRVNDKYNVENGGDMHILEHISLKDKDVLEDDLEVQNPHVLTGTWKYIRRWHRHREPYFEILEAICAQSGHDAVDANGNAYFDFEGHK